MGNRRSKHKTVSGSSSSSHSHQIAERPESDTQADTSTKSEEDRTIKGVVRKVSHKVGRKSKKPQAPVIESLSTPESQPPLGLVSFATTGTPVLLDPHKQQEIELFLKITTEEGGQVDPKEAKSEDAHKIPAIEVVATKPPEELVAYPKKEVVPFANEIKEEIVLRPREEVVPFASEIKEEIVLRPREEIVPCPTEMKEKIVAYQKGELVPCLSPKSAAKFKQIAVIPNQHREVAILVDKYALIMTHKQREEMAIQVEKSEKHTKEI
jgi:hypothetical protein